MLLRNLYSTIALQTPHTIKRFTFGFLAVVLFSTAALAGDSTWLLGDDGKIALNTFEHRAGEGDGRETSVTLIYGEHFLSGKLKDVDSGKITLKASSSIPENAYVFKGSISIDYDKSEITLKGKMTVGDTEIDTYSTTITCKQMGE